MKNPRVAVTVTEHQYELLGRLARVNKQSMSSIVGELLESCEPVLERVADLCEFAVKAKEEQKEGMRRAMEEAQSEIEPIMLKALKTLGVEPRTAGTPSQPYESDRR